jgi:hypothetical protein
MSSEAIEYLIRRYNVDVRYNRPIKSVSSLYVHPGCMPILSVREGLEGRERVEAVAVQLARLMLGHSGRRFLWTHERQDRKEWRQALRTAARLYISDEDMDRAERRHYDPWELADELDVTVRLVLVRAEEWFQQAGRVVSFEIRRSVDEAMFAWAGGEGW